MRFRWRTFPIDSSHSPCHAGNINLAQACRHAIKRPTSASASGTTSCAISVRIPGGRLGKFVDTDPHQCCSQANTFPGCRIARPGRSCANGWAGAVGGAPSDPSGWKRNTPESDVATELLRDGYFARSRSPTTRATARAPNRADGRSSWARRSPRNGSARFAPRRTGPGCAGHGR